jgi:RimJ/RimL family protein N-acetyltransferase
MPLAYAVRTPRLCLRCYEARDAASLKAAIDVSLDSLRRWMPWARDEPSSIEVIVTRLAQIRHNFLSATDWGYGVFERDGTDVLGGIGLHPRIGPGALEIGYWLRTDQTGRGIMTEGVAALTRVAFDVHGVGRVEIRCDPRNAPSAAIPRRLGYTLETTLRGNTVDSDGLPRDTLIWAMTRERFAATPAASIPITHE